MEEMYQTKSETVKPEQIDDSLEDVDIKFGGKSSPGMQSKVNEEKKMESLEIS